MQRTYRNYANHHFYAAAALIIVLCLAVSAVTDYFIKCNTVRDGVLRLHVIAQSDSPEDQEIKLRVRDSLLEAGAGIFDGSVSADEAEEKITPYIPMLESTACEVLKNGNFDYTADVKIVREYFNERSYGEKTLPAGEYTALKVVLGSGKGKNWWCVMFPPLCLPAAQASENDAAFDIFRGDGEHVVGNSGEYRVRFKIVEVIEDIINRIKD